MNIIALLMAHKAMKRQLPFIVKSIIKQQQIASKFRRDNPRPKYKPPDFAIKYFENDNKG